MVWQAYFVTEEACFAVRQAYSASEKAYFVVGRACFVANPDGLDCRRSSAHNRSLFDLSVSFLFTEVLQTEPLL